MSDLSHDHDLEAIAAALGMSTRWVRARIAEGAEHIRYGNRIRMTTEQVDKLRAQNTRGATPAQSITTGRKRKSA